MKLSLNMHRGQLVLNQTIFIGSIILVFLLIITLTGHVMIKGKVGKYKSSGIFEWFYVARLLSFCLLNYTS